MNLDEERAYIAETALANFHEECNEMDEGSFKDNTDAMELYMKYAMQFPQLEPQLEMILADTAKKYRISKKTISDCIKVYKRSTRPVSGEGTLTAWEGQPFAVNVGNYILDGDGIREQNGSLMVPVCSHPIMPSKRYIDIESGEESIDLSYKRDGRWNTITVEKTLISDAGKIVPLSGKGISVTSENARALVRYLSYVDDRNRAQIPIERISTHIGWVGEKEFVPYAPGISYGGMESLRQMFDTIQPHGSYELWLDEAKRIRAEAGSVPARLALAASFASPMLIKLGALCFMVHLWSARSGSGKTVTLELAASVWGNPDVGYYVKSLKATTVAIEQMAVFCKHLPLPLDELQTIQTQDKFDEIIYMLCEGHGKERGSRNGGLRATPSWRNITITNGEMPIIGDNSKAGSVNRVIEIEGQQDFLSDPQRTAHAVQANYGHAGRAFIEQLPEHLADARKRYEELSGELMRHCTSKQALSAAALLAADELSEKLIFQDGVRLKISDILPYLKTDRDVDTNRRAHEWLLGWVSENYTSFVRELTNGEDATEQGLKVLGKIEQKPGGGRVAWINQKVCKEILTNAGYNFKSYFNWAKARSLLDRKDQKEYEYTPKIGIRTGNVTRCIGILIDKSINEVMMEVVHDQDMPWD